MLTFTRPGNIFDHRWVFWLPCPRSSPASSARFLWRLASRLKETENRYHSDPREIQLTFMSKKNKNYINPCLNSLIYISVFNMWKKYLNVWWHDNTTMPCHGDFTARETHQLWYPIEFYFMFLSVHTQCIYIYIYIMYIYIYNYTYILIELYQLYIYIIYI